MVVTKAMMPARLESSEGNVHALLTKIYGCVPQPTAGECAYYEFTPPEKLLEIGVKDQALRLARIAVADGDESLKRMACELWNAVTTEMPYASAELLLGVEGEPIENIPE